MKRLFLVLIATVLASIGLAATADDLSSTRPAGSASAADRPIANCNAWAGDSQETGDRARTREFVLGAILKPGDTGDLIREVQASLNRELWNQSDGEKGKICMPRDTYKVRMAGSVPKLLIIRSGIELNLRDLPDDHWVANEEENSLQLPKTPLKVDGIYGQQTYAAVLVFQVLVKLQQTGTVDVVTLDKLEPMIPPKKFLAIVMSWVDEFLNPDSDNRGYSALDTKTYTAVVTTFLILCIAFVAHRVARGLAKAPVVLERFLAPWVGAFVEQKVFRRMAHFAPALVIYIAAALVFPAPEESGRGTFPYLNTFQISQVVVSRAGLAYAALAFMLVGLAIVDSLRKAYKLTDGAVEGIIRVVRQVIALIGVVLIFAALAGRNPMYFVGGLGAFMAVIILAFRDSILGLVASIQITSRKLVRKGNWIQIPSRDADGEVQEITLNSVTVQNFDKSITTIPTYDLLSESFRNLGDLLGRRIKRAILIDIQSVKACTPEMLEGYAKIELLRKYIETKKEDLEKYNSEHDVEESVLNGRRLTNIGTFRVYVEAYLANHPMLSNEMTCLVRQLDPGALGLPIEVYAFCIDTGFKEYEAVQADIFDHVLSILPEFELRAFQNFPNPAA